MCTTRSPVHSTLSEHISHLVTCFTLIQYCSTLFKMTFSVTAVHKTDPMITRFDVALMIVCAVFAPTLNLCPGRKRFIPGGYNTNGVQHWENPVICGSLSITKTNDWEGCRWNQHHNLPTFTISSRPSNAKKHGIVTFNRSPDSAVYQMLPRSGDIYQVFLVASWQGISGLKCGTHLHYLVSNHWGKGGCGFALQSPWNYSLKQSMCTCVHISHIPFHQCYHKRLLITVLRNP